MKPFNDFIVKKGGKLYTKFVSDDLDYVSNQIQKNNPQDLSLREVTNSTEPTGGKVETHFYKNIPYRSIVVNSDLPHMSSLYEGLTPWQTGQLDRALKTGLSKTNMKAGSLESWPSVNNLLFLINFYRMVCLFGKEEKCMMNTKIVATAFGGG